MRYEEPEAPGADALPLMCGQGWVLVGAGAAAELVPDEVLAPGDGLAAADDEVVRAIVVPVAAVPPVAASATPVPPAPTAAATKAVMITRRARLLILEAIWFPPFLTTAAWAIASSRRSAWSA